MGSISRGNRLARDAARATCADTTKGNARMQRRHLLLATAGLAAPAILPGRLALAQGAYPGRPVRMVGPWPPGQSTDLMARITGQRVSELWGQPIIPENRAGAGGMIGTDNVA